MREQFEKIEDENVKKAIIGFRAELNQGEQLLDYEKAVASPDGKCFKIFLADGTDTFIKCGDGTLKSSNEAAREYHRLFRKLNTCLVVNNSTLEEDFLDKLDSRMFQLVTKYSDAIIQGKNKVR